MFFSSSFSAHVLHVYLIKFSAPGLYAPIHAHKYAFIYAHTVTLRNDNEGCHLLTTEDTCVASKDGRDATIYAGSPCHWCCGKPCTNNGNKCEPSSFLATKQNVFKISSRNGQGHNDCAATGEDCVLCMIASTPLCHAMPYHFKHT